MKANQSINPVFQIATSLPNISISSKSYIPAIKFDADNGILLLKSKLDQQQLPYLYFPILSQLNRYLAKNEPLIIGLFIDELDTFNLKVIFDLFSFLKKHQRSDSFVIVKWFLSPFDESIRQTARDFTELFDLNSEIVPSNLK